MQLRVNREFLLTEQKQKNFACKLLIIYCILCVTEKSYQQLGLRVSSGIEIPRSNKALGLWPPAFSVFRCLDTLVKHEALVVEILHSNLDVDLGHSMKPLMLSCLNIVLFSVKLN